MSSRASSAIMAVPTVRTATAIKTGSAMRGPPVVYHDLDIALVLWLDRKLGRRVDQVLLGERGQLIVVCHKERVERARVDAQPAEHALAKVNLGHDGLLVLLPRLVDLDHADGFRDAFARYRAELAASALVVEQDVPAPI